MEATSDQQNGLGIGLGLGLPPAGNTAVAYLIGHPIAHSSSPRLHECISESTGTPYRQVLVESLDLAGFLAYLRNHPQTPKLLGSGVTMPHKVAVLPLLDELTPEGAAVGAVNTVFLRQDPGCESESEAGKVKLVGHNTDTIGIRDAFLNNVCPAEISARRGKPGLIVGAGGTCRAAIYALQTFLGCEPIYIINRDESEVRAVLDECRAHGTADNKLIYLSSVDQAQVVELSPLIVSAVPNFTPSTEGERTVRQILLHFLQTGKGGSLLEMCYHPSPDTQIAQLAQENGWQVIGGIEAMVGQGCAQSQLWAGVEITDHVRTVARSAVLNKLQ